MSLDRAAIAVAIAEHGPVARVLVAEIRGSTPREVGAAMLVWAGGQSGTIGGGALEHQAAQAARTALAHGGARVTRHPLGPELGQCCGGAVTLVTEVFTPEALAALGPNGPALRRVAGDADPPLALRQAMRRARGEGIAPATRLQEGWLIEPEAPKGAPLWIWGAGHVGRAIVDVLSPMPDFAITWVDTAPDRFPETLPAGLTALPAAEPTALAARAPDDAMHLILTFSHALDLDLCHALLSRPARSIGLIGSATKWARFRRRLAVLGHTEAQIARITCPIGNPGLGKHPQAIAIGVAATILSTTHTGALEASA